MFFQGLETNFWIHPLHVHGTLYDDAIRALESGPQIGSEEVRQAAREEFMKKLWVNDEAFKSLCNRNN